MTLALLLIIALGALSIAYGVVTAREVLARDAGSARMQEIALAIQEGASAYLRRQYTTIGIVGAALFVLIVVAFGFGGHAFAVGIGFLIGALLSGAAGFIGMNVSVRANVRTAQAATQSLAAGLDVAFKSGAITGMLVAGLALLGVAGYFLILVPIGGAAPNSRLVIDALVALGFGASLISIFARLGGGIFTKGADVGGDMVGKVEAGIPEDDPRNPATIADNVGDNVGDCAGMAADLFETYAVTAVATMVLAAITFGEAGRAAAMLYPLAIGGVCVITSIIGHLFREAAGEQFDHGRDVSRLIVTGALSLAVLLPLPIWCSAPARWWRAGRLLGLQPVPCGPVGLAVTAAIVWITGILHRTQFRPVKAIAEASQTGHGTNEIRGLAVSMESTAIPALIIIAGILSSFAGGPLRRSHRHHDDAGAGRHDRGARRLRPVTDNAGGIAEMAGLPPETRVHRPMRWTRWATPPRR
jgi:K(+)-stimulated pyrophosphate-energized sodium pump